MADWEAFCEFLSKRQPPRSLSESTAGDAMEFLLSLTSDKIMKVASSLSTATFKGIDGDHKENPFGIPIVKTFLKELVKRQSIEKEYDEKTSTRPRAGGYKPENLFEKCLTISDVGGLNRLVVTANKDAGKYVHLATLLQGTDSLLRLEDEEGKPWLFGFSYLNLSQSYEFTKGWSSYVKEKQLGAGDFVFFQRHRTDISRLVISCRRRADGGATPGDWDHLRCPDPTSPVTSSETLELREKLKEIETPLQLRLSEHNIRWFEPILIVYCGDNQDSEETYFISYIFNELCLRGFNLCRYDLSRSAGTGKSDILHKSRVCILIISINYSRSRECLDEFLAIMGHVKANEMALLPVFFKVKLSDIMGQFSSFENAFSGLGNSVQASQVLKWRAAMIGATSINRYHYIKGDELMLAKSIVRDVCFLLNSDTNGNSMGTRLQVKNILSLLHYSQSSAPQIVGLWGMAGIGKTNIAREIFRTQAERYDVSYFLPDFQLMCQTKGLSHLRDEFFSKIFGEEKVFIDACDTKLSFTRDRFLDKKVLIVFDGVTNARDVELLVGGFGWFSGGHTIILTSRNRRVLIQCKAKELYEIPKLSESQSLRICFQYATQQNWKESGSLISEMVNYASGNPLALRVLCSSVQNQCIYDEKQHLRRLRQNPPIEIHDAFRRSFDGLHDNEKNILLDLACFFRGQNKDHVVNMLDSCGFFADLGIHALIDESLINLVENRLEMPNIFQDMGRFVVCQENNEAGKRSRLWDSNDISDVLTNNAGTKAIEGIFFYASGLTFELNPTVFERMHRLRLLKLHYSTTENHSKLCLPQGLYSLPDELRLLHWERYPLGSLPRNFNPKNLVELNMPYSNMTKLWKGTKNLEKLKRIILSHSQKLTKLPRLSKARNLEHIDLEGCTSLVKVNSSILHHHKLTFLSLKDCSHLRVLPTTVHLESLEVLNISGCSELEDLRDFSTNLKKLYLAGTAIREMPSSTKDLTRLVTLDLENCKNLQHLPPGISNLKAVVKLSGCSNLMNLPILDALFLPGPQRLNRKITMKASLHSAIQESSRDVLPAFGYLSSDRIPQESWPGVITPLPFSILLSLTSRLYALVSLFLRNAYVVDIPEELCWLASLKALDLGGNSFSKIPESIKVLCKLHSLRLRHCKNLISLPELPGSLEILNAHGCVSLKYLPSGFEHFPRHYIFSNCFALSPEVVRNYIRKALNSVEVIAKGHQQEHNNMPAFSICIPTSIGDVSLVNSKAGSSVMIELTPDMLKTLSGFGLSVEVEFQDNYHNAAGFGIKFICRTDGPDLSPKLERNFRCWAPKEAPTVKKDHTFVFGVANMHFADGTFHDYLAGWVNFEFHPVNWQNKLLDDSCTVKRCGVYLITPATCYRTHSAKRPVMDLGELSSMEHTGPPYKRCRLKRVIEDVILSLWKRKREKSVSRSTNLAEAEGMIIAKQYRCIHSATCHCTKGHLSEEVLFLMVQHLNWNPIVIATLSCVCKWFDDLAKRLLWKEFCRARAPKMMCDLQSSGSHSVDGSWRALGKLLIYCSGSSKGGLFNVVQIPGHVVHRTRFSRTSGRSFLPPQCRTDDILYVSDPCEHLDQGEDGDLGFFRGIFKSFSVSKVRKLLIKKGTSFHPTEVCPYCKAKLWSMLQAKMIPRKASCRLGAYEYSIEYYVCLNGHMLGVCTLLPLSDSKGASEFQ